MQMCGGCLVLLICLGPILMVRCYYVIFNSYFFFIGSYVPLVFTPSCSNGSTRLNLLPLLESTHVDRSQSIMNGHVVTMNLVQFLKTFQLLSFPLVMSDVQCHTLILYLGVFIQFSLVGASHLFPWARFDYICLILCGCWVLIFFLKGGIFFFDLLNRTSCAPYKEPLQHSFRNGWVGM